MNISRQQTHTISLAAECQAAQELATLIQASGFVPDAIVCLPRGGLVTAQIIAYSLGCRNIYMLQTMGYDDQDQALPTVELLQTPPPEKLANKRLLVVDSLLQHGSAMVAANKWLKAIDQPPKEIRLAVPYLRDVPHKIQPDYYCKVLPDRPIVFESQQSLAA